MTPEAALIESLLKMARRHGASPDELAWLVRAKQRATVLVFLDGGRDEFGASLFTVGDPTAPVTFAAKSEGVRALHLLAVRKALAVQLVTDAVNAPEAARLLLKRGLCELRSYCPALSEELKTFAIEDGVVRYRRGASSPTIATDRVGLALVCGTSAALGEKIESHDHEPEEMTT